MKNYVEQISGANFQGRNFNYPLRPVTVLCGENSIGKTATTNAIRILLLGYSPAHGKQSAKTFGFAGSLTGASNMSIKGVVCDKPVERAWEFKKKKITSSGFEGEIVPPVLLDANEWLKLSGPAKTKFVFNLIDLSTLGFSPEQIAARLKKDVKVENPDEVSERFIGEVIQTVYDLAEHREHEGQTYQEYIDGVIAYFDGQQSKAKIVIDDMAGAISGTTQLQAQEGLKPIQNITDDLSAARLALQTATTDFQILDRAKNDQASKATRKASLAARLATMSDRSDMIRLSEEQFEGQRRILTAYKSETIDLVRRLTTAQAAHASAKQKAEEITSEMLTLRDKLAEDLKLDRCPHCGSKGKSWKAALTESVEEKIVEMEKSRGVWHTKSVAEFDAINKLETEVSKSKQLDTANDTLRGDNFTLGRAITTAKNEQNEYTTAKARLEEIGDVGEPIDATRIQAAQQIVALARTEVERFEGLERQQIAAMSDARRQEQARQAHAEKLIEFEVYKLALKTMKALQVEMMESAFVKFMEKMNLIADGIFPGGKLVFHEGEIGYWAGATFVPMEYFGGTEQMLAFAGLSLTLAQDSKMKIIIMDELGRVSRARRIKLIKRMITLVRDGVIDQFIGIDVSDDAYTVFKDVEEVAVIEIQ